MNLSKTASSILVSTALLGAASGVQATSAMAGTPTRPINLTGTGVSGSDQSVGVSSSGVRTSVWKQNIGPYDSATGSSVHASRITTKTTTVITGKGRKRKRVRRTSDVVSPLTVYETAGRFISEVVSSTTPAGVTTVAWSVADPAGNKVSLFARRIDAAGALGQTVELEPEGTRAHDLRIASAANGRTLVLWRSDDTQVSWVEAKVIDSSGQAGSLLQVTPDHGAYHDVVLAARANGSFDVAWRNGNGARSITQAVRIGTDNSVAKPLDLGNPANSSNDDQAITTGPNGTTVVAWSESTDTAWILKIAKIDSANHLRATVELTRSDYPYLPALGIAADGTTTVAWLYSAGRSARVRAIRVTANNSKSKVVDFGPTKETLVSGFGPSLTVAPNGTATMAWSVVSNQGFPSPVYLQAFQVSPNGKKILSTRLVLPNAANPELANYPVITSSSNGTALIGYRRASAFGGPSVLKLTTW